MTHTEISTHISRNKGVNGPQRPVSFQTRDEKRGTENTVKALFAPWNNCCIREILGGNWARLLGWGGAFKYEGRLNG